MSKTKTTIIICASIFAFFALLILLSGERDAGTEIGLCALLLGILYFFVGIILCIPDASRQVGKAMLICSGIIFLIGIGLCSVYQVNFH